jgi:hypothetical protein
VNNRFVAPAPATAVLALLGLMALAPRRMTARLSARPAKQWHR